MFFYMSNFGYVPKALNIKNPTKVRNVIDKQVSKLAQSAKLVSSDSNVRKSASNSYAALKHTKKQLPMSRATRRSY